jgi:hypothetical protein
MGSINGWTSEKFGMKWQFEAAIASMTATFCWISTSCYISCVPEEFKISTQYPTSFNNHIRPRDWIIREIPDLSKHPFQKRRSGDCYTNIAAKSKLVYL